jgi:predicted PurR-regulated permease PerM
MSAAEKKIAMPNAQIPPVLRFALYGASFVILVAGLRAAAPILTPLALAVFVAAVNLPALGWLRRHGAPTWLAILLIVLFSGAILGFFAWIVLQSAAELRAELPGYIARGQQIEQSIRGRLLGWGIDIAPGYYWTLAEPLRLLDMVTVAARNVTSLLVFFFLTLLYLVFILAESVVLPRKVGLVLGPSANGVTGAAAALAQVQRYLLLKTLISVVTGAAVGTGAALLGVDFALLWGLLAFLLNFIPSIGSIIAAVPPVLFALLQLGLGRAIALGAVYLGVNVLVGNFGDPVLIGRQLRLSPIIVLVSLVFWGWTWGLPGMFLAVPLTIALRIGLENTRSLGKYAALMGPVVAEPGGPRPPPPA